jgi:hypothetical protein
VSELSVGDIIRDNNPRLTRERRLRVTAVIAREGGRPAKVAAEDSVTRGGLSIARSRVYTDDTPRRSGFSLVRP